MATLISLFALHVKIQFYSFNSLRASLNNSRTKTATQLSVHFADRSVYCIKCEPIWRFHRNSFKNKFLQNFLNQDNWRFVQIEIHLVLREILRIYKMKLRNKRAVLAVDFFFAVKLDTECSLPLRNIPHERTTAWLNYLVIKIHFRLRCDPYHVFGLYVTVTNPRNRWQHTAQLRDNIYKSFLISWNSWASITQDKILF